MVGMGERVPPLESTIKSEDTVLLSGRSNEALVTSGAEWYTSSGDVLSDVDRAAALRDETC